MFDQIDLHQLAEMRGPDRAFLSVYLSSPEAWKALGQRIREIEQLLSETPDEAEHFRENLARVETWLENNSYKSGALCLFTCWALDFQQAIPLEKDVEDLLWVDAGPYLRPLAELQDEYENFVVVTADNSDARIYLVRSATPSEEERVKGGIKNHVKKGGWSQKRYSRRRDNELMHYARDIAAALAEINKREEFERIFMVGSDETLQEIARNLGPEVSEKLIETQAVDLHQPDEVWAEVFRLFEEEERKSELALWERIRAEFLQGGRAVLGLDKVLEAVTLGRAEHVMVTRDAEISGSKCRECENLSTNGRATCRYCHSKDLFHVDLVNELVRLAAATGAPTEFSDSIPALTEAGHVAALLRY